jgi:hypothetical protein
MGLDFKKIKNLFVVEEGTEQSQDKIKKEEVSTSKEKDTSKENTTNNLPSNIPQSVSSGVLDQKIFDSLIKVLEKNNMPGEDYMEFIEALQNMKNIPLEETVKMQTVLATLSTKGLTKQKILESADFYIKVLEDEKKKFNEALKQETVKQVESKQKEIKSLEEQNKSKSEQIAQLTTEINQNQQQITKTKSLAEEASLKIKSTENNFIYTYEAVVSQIRTNVSKINTVK